MHELSLVVNLVAQLEAIAAEHGATRVRRCKLEVGALANVVPELLKDAVEVVRTERPVLVDCSIEVEHVPLRVHCTACDRTTEPDSFRFECPSCGSSAVTTEAGDELLLRQVELEIPDERPVP